MNYKIRIFKNNIMYNIITNSFHFLKHIYKKNISIFYKDMDNLENRNKIIKIMANPIPNILL
uniref:Uncharacterized protein n=1 Tax=viral metagenome TaxID=1070528 RepID=A0A6C0H5X2_9ZZZZ